MKVELLKSDRIQDFIMYCKKHKKEIDESFLYDEDLNNFEPNYENPTYIITNQEGVLIATASLIIDDYNRKGRKARFRIFHSEVEDIACYKMLMQAIIKHTEGLDKIYMFIPIINKKLTEYIKELNFTVERHSFFLVREENNVPAYSLPEGYEIRSFRPGIDEDTYCKVRNVTFAKLLGSETPIIPEMVSTIISDTDYIDGGIMFLYHKENPIGVVRGADDEYEGSPAMNIGPIAIIPEYQGKGLGRSLLRASLQFAKEKSYKRTSLCVNAENERAKALYIQEGFNEVEAVTCFQYDLRR